MLYTEVHLDAERRRNFGDAPSVSPGVRIVGPKRRRQARDAAAMTGASTADETEMNYVQQMGAAGERNMAQPKREHHRA